VGRREERAGRATSKEPDRGREQNGELRFSSSTVLTAIDSPITLLLSLALPYTGHVCYYPL
jgi:hypothetical protein